LRLVHAQILPDRARLRGWLRQSGCPGCHRQRATGYSVPALCRTLRRGPSRAEACLAKCLAALAGGGD
jgi:hypothetical protein